MKLCPEEIQETAEEGMRRQRKTSFQVSGQEDPLALARLRLHFRPRQPPRPGRYQAVGDEVQNILLRDGRRQEVALDPSRGSRCSSARWLLPLRHFLGALQLRRLVLRHCCGGGRIRDGRRGGGTEEAGEARGKLAHCCKFPLPSFIIPVDSGH
jgi:hypothetical protein